MAASRPVSFDEVEAPPGLEGLGSPVVDKSVHVVTHDEHDPFFVIRNTFIDTVLQRPLSLDGFFQPREIHSCPASRPTSMDEMDLPPGLENLLEIINEDCPSTPPASVTKVIEQEQPAIGEACPYDCGADAMGAVGLSSLPPPPVSWAPTMTQFAVTAPPPPSFSPGGSIFQLNLSQMLTEPEADSSFLPSVGSAGHSTGDCKPCAFFHSKGCGNGTRCTFCHVCGPDEKKRRRVEKKQQKRLFGHSNASYSAY